VTEWAIEPLTDNHDRALFDCGKAPLNDWIQRFGGQFHRRGLTRVYVLVRPGQARCLGYYAISNQHIEFAHLPRSRAKKLPSRLKLPVVLIGQLAVDRTVQGQGFGDALLGNALRRILALADQVGILAVVVDALDDEARAYYLRKNFEPFQDEPSRLFLMLHDLRRAGAKPLEGGPAGSASVVAPAEKKK
jgi:GNAT superfamily N-acetyltransferase